MESLLIHRNISALLQSLRDSVNRGYTYWTDGTVKTLKIEGLCKKFHAQYGVLDSRHRRDYNHRLGRANSYLIVYPQPGGDVFDWLLIVTEGKGEVHEHEKLRDHFGKEHKDRIRWRHYEIVTLDGKMTWRLRREVAEEWEKKIVSAARKTDISDLERTVEILCNFPLFSGVRTQVWKMLEKARKTRIRYHHSIQFKVPKLPYLQRITVYDTPPKTLGMLVDAYKVRLQTMAKIEDIK